MQSDGSELDEDAASSEPEDPVAQLEQRRSSAKEAVPSGRDAPSPEDDVFRRFDRIVDDWGLVKLQPLIYGTRSLNVEDAIASSIGSTTLHLITHFGQN